MASASDHPPDFSALARRPEARRVLTSWRRLTTGTGRPDTSRPTLLACSAGADSSALAIILGTSGARLVVGHVVHDLRPPADAHADRDAAADLAKRLRLPFAHASVRVRDLPGNAEGNARRARYHALAAMAREHSLAFVATAHHADDQAETLLMRLIRGSGPRGLRGIAPRRALEPGLTLVRPMLMLSRDQARHLCRDAGHEWREDATNADLSRLRAAVRHRVLPEILRAAPGFLRQGASTALVMRGVEEALEAQARALLAAAERGTASLQWTRAGLACQPALAIAGALKLGARHLLAGRLADRLPSRNLLGVAQAIRDASTDPRRFQWAGLDVRVTAHDVTLARTDAP